MAPLAMIASTIAVATVWMIRRVTNKLGGVKGVVNQDIQMRCATNVSILFCSYLSLSLSLSLSCSEFHVIMINRST